MLTIRLGEAYDMRNIMAIHRDFKGVWIPKDIWLAPDLTLQEKCLLVEIGSFERQQGCRATNEHFSQFLGVGRMTVIRMIMSLEQRKIISAERKNTDGKMTRIIKTIVPFWDGGTVPKRAKPPSQPDTVTTYIHSNNTEHRGSTENQHKKMTKKELYDEKRRIGETVNPSDRINDIIGSFSKVNPGMFKTWYKNKAQRTACDRLIDEYGFDQVMKVVRFLPVSNVMAYVPNITSPFDLAKDYAKLRNALEKEKSKRSAAISKSRKII